MEDGLSLNPIYLSTLGWFNVLFFSRYASFPGMPLFPGMPPGVGFPCVFIPSIFVSQLRKAQDDSDGFGQNLNAQWRQKDHRPLIVAMTPQTKKIKRTKHASYKGCHVLHLPLPKASRMISTIGRTVTERDTIHQLFSNISNFFRWLATTHPSNRRSFPCSFPSGWSIELPGLHLSVHRDGPSDAAGNNSEWTQNEEGNQPHIGRSAASRCTVLKRRFSNRAVEALRPSCFGKRISRTIAALISSLGGIPSSLAFLALRNMSLFSLMEREYFPRMPGRISASCTHFARISGCPWSTCSSTMSTFWEIQQHDNHEPKPGAFGIGC